MHEREPSKVVIVAENACTVFGGESILPWQYFRLLFRRGVDVRLVTHERNQADLARLLPEALDRMHFVPDLPIQRWLMRAGEGLPDRIFENTFGLAIHVVTSLMQRRVVRGLVQAHGIHVIHEPTPVSPKQPSFMFDLEAPVVIGPLNGGMDFPPAFSDPEGMLERLVMRGGRRVANLFNHWIPGKRKASVLLVANQRTRDALPEAVTGNIVMLSENGVDLSTFSRSVVRAPRAPGALRCAFMGRLVDWKRVDLLIEALALCPPTYELLVIGDGPLKASLEAQVASLGLKERVRFRGMLTHQECRQALLDCDALVLPSMRECGGAVVLEAMAMALPVIATDWGGPQDYVDEQTGILVPPSSHQAFVAGLRDAMLRLGDSPDLRIELGSQGRLRVEQEFDWERKVDRMLEIYRDAANLPRLPKLRPKYAEQSEQPQ